MSNAARFSAWVALMAFSAMCLGAHLTNTERERIFFQATVPRREPGKQNWVTAVTSISTAFSFLATIAFLAAKKVFVGQKVELTIALFLAVIWAAGLPVITAPTNRIAAGLLTIIDYNLYFFSWAAFDATLYIIGNFYKASIQLQCWCSLTLCSVVVMGSSARLFRNSACSNDAQDELILNCRRIKYAVSLGAFNTVSCLGVFCLASREKIGLKPTTGAAIIITAMYTVGVAFITFGGGAGSLILGNLYFFTWIGFLFALLIASASVYTLVHGDEEEEDAPEPEEKKNLSDPEEQALDEENSDPEVEASVGIPSLATSGDS